MILDVCGLQLATSDSVEVFVAGRVGDCWLIAAIAAVAEFHYLEDYVFGRKETWGRLRSN